MEYLSFDIECANHYRGAAKICSFGYVRTDDRFRVLEKEDWIINPKASFHRGMEKIGDVHLAYTPEQFRRAPAFDAVYPHIKELLEAPDRLIVGHSVANDNCYLADECKRYKLAPIRYRFIDAQTIHCAHARAPHLCSLDKIAEEYGIRFVAHKSDDDAYATIRYLEQICRKEGKTLEELLRAYDIVPGRTGSDDACPMTCGALEKTGKTREIDRFRKFLRDNAPTANGDLSGKKFCFNLHLERRDLAYSAALIRRINERGGRVVAHARDCNVFIFDEEKPCARCRSAEISRQKGKRIKYWTEARLNETLNSETNSKP